MGKHEQQLTQILQTNAQPRNEKTHELTQAHLNEYIHGHDTKHKILKKLLELRKRHIKAPELRQLEPNEHETAAQIMLKIPPNAST